MIRFQYLKEHRNSVRIDEDAENEENDSPSPNTDDLLLTSTLMCEYMMAASQFVQFGYDYYEYVCGTDKASTLTEEKSCLIPVCSFQPVNSASSKVGFKRGLGEDDDNQRPEKTTLNFADDYTLQGDKRQRLEKGSMNIVRAQINTEFDNERGSGLDSYCVKGVDEALQILSKAGDCLRHIVELWQWATTKMSQQSVTDLTGGWEKGKSFICCSKLANSSMFFRTYSCH